MKQVIRRIVIDRSYPGRRRPELDGGEDRFETFHVDGIATVEVDLSAVDAMIVRALTSRGKRCVDGPLEVRFSGEVRSSWSPDQKAWGLPEEPAPVAAGGAE